MNVLLCDKYEVIKCIGAGGMGSVYLAKDRHLSRYVAVKVCKKISDADIRDGIIKEKEVLQRLSHPALPAIYDFFEEEGMLCLVMEYVEGITLKEYLQKYKKAEEAKAVRWCLEIAEVLSYLHAQNPPVIYRDLKPSNVILQPDGKVRLIDFGTAHIFSSGLFKEQLLMGTPGYSAPEQLKAGICSRAGDVYALGAVLHELLTGASGSRNAGMKRPVREYDRSISGALEKIVSICMREKPSGRYQSMEQLKEALLSCQRGTVWKKHVFGLHNVAILLLWSLAIFKLLAPLVKGIPADTFPFPFLGEPICYLAAALFFQLMTKKRERRKKRQIKVEKSILLTEKKFAGWYFLFLTIFFTGWISLEEIPVKSAEEAGVLWVEMRDEDNRKLLLKEDATYRPKERVRFDITNDSLPKGKLAVQILAVDEEGEVYESRVFLVEGN